MMGEIYERALQVLTWLGEPLIKDGSSGKIDVPSPSALDYELPLLEWGYNERDIFVMKRFFINEKAFKDWLVIGALSTLALLVRDCYLNILLFF